MSRPRVILVEDDASVRRFVALALEELPIELLSFDSVAGALAALAQAPACLVLTDLMLPGESGQALVERLTADPALRGRARVAVFSAGLTPEVRDRLAGLGVWRLLSKPVSLAELESCVREAMAGTHDAAADPRAVASTRLSGAPCPLTPGPASADARRAAAVSTHFGGDTELFEAYRSSCLQQFAADRLAGDTALAAADWAALRRLGHSLKTVLLTLGEPRASADAATLEAACARADASAAQQLWPALREQLATLHQPAEPDSN